MWSNTGMANRQGDVDLCFAQVSAPTVNTSAWLGSARLGSFRAQFKKITHQEQPAQGHKKK